MKRILTIVLAGVLALAMAVPAMASDESVTIVPSQTFSGVPATITYTTPGGVKAGSNADATSFVIEAGTANNNNGYKVEASFTNLTHTNLSDTLPVSVHRVKLTAALQPNTTFASGILNNQWYSWAAAASANALLFSSTQAQATNDFVTTDLRLVIPGSVVPGTYNGTATFTFTLK